MYNSLNRSRRGGSWVVATSIVSLAFILSSSIWINSQARNRGPESPIRKAEQKVRSSNFISSLRTETPALRAVKQRTPENFTADGCIEADQRKVQQITPLVMGRVSNIFVSTGARVKKGDLLLVIESPQVAELHGRMHEAETRLALAEGQFRRVREGANKVNILKAKASLDEADATLRRDRLLESEGLTPKKELIASESDYKRAEAEFDFQKDISLNHEIAEAKSALTTAKNEVEHLREGLKALDGFFNPSIEGSQHEISKIELRAPISGTVVERFVNPGAGVDACKPLVTIADISSEWTIANVPEKRLNQVHVGMNTRVTVDGKTYAGKVSYIDPRLNHDTRTARVTIELKNMAEPVATESIAQIVFLARNSDEPV